MGYTLPTAPAYFLHYNVAYQNITNSFKKKERKLALDAIRVWNNVSGSNQLFLIVLEKVCSLTNAANFMLKVKT